MHKPGSRINDIKSKPFYRLCAHIILFLPSADSIATSDGVSIVATSSNTSTGGSLVFERSPDGANASMTFGDGVAVNASGDVLILGDALVTGVLILLRVCVA